MKILRIEYKKIKLSNESIIFDFVATDKIANKDQVFVLSKNINLQKAIAIAGINATGKTTALRLIKFAAGLLNDNSYLRKEKLECSLFQEDTHIVIDFIIDNTIFRIDSTIGESLENVNDVINKRYFYYKNETLFSKDISLVKLKKDLFNWSSYDSKIERADLEKKGFLDLVNDYQSILALSTKKQKLPFISLIDTTNFNFLMENVSFNKTYANLFDNSLEKVMFSNKDQLEIKFKNNKSSSTIDINDQYKMLSSGTIKGIGLLEAIKIILDSGGYLLLDEIEVHLNKTLVQVIIDVFMDPRINTNGAVLIFTTHYMEILDVISRKDAIYVSKRDDSFNLVIEKFSDRINRNDVKKSEVLLSNYFGKTAPSYEAINQVKKELCKKVD